MARLVVFGEPDDSRKWVHCANAISERVSDGRYPDGEWLPPLGKICADVGMGHVLVHRALTELHSHALISKEIEGYYAGSGGPPAKLPGILLKHWPQAHSEKPAAVSEPYGPRAALFQEQYITVKEFAALLKASNMTVYRLVRAGKIDGVIKISERVYRIPVSGAQEYLKRSVVNGRLLDTGTDDVEDEEDE